jgi:phosphoglycolate phosphatase-like HAD superfamily hydrolase
MTMRLALFDIDGTILSARGAGRRALGQALTEVYGTAGPIDSYDFHGGTDLQIVRDLLTLAGLSGGEIAAGEARLFARYTECLAAEVGDGREVTLYPGVAEVVRSLAAEDACLVGLLTGNIEAGARIKLEPTGLRPCFRLGAYGSDDADRTRLPAVAARRAEALVARPFRGADMVVIGDTPRDVACGRAAGALVIAVATGRHTMTDLRQCGADHVFQDFADAARVVAAVLDGKGAER